MIVKYKDKSDCLIPHYSEQYYNRKLKVLFEAAGLDRIIVKYDKVKRPMFRNHFIPLQQVTLHVKLQFQDYTMLGALWI